MVWLGMNGFLPERGVPERAKDSRERFPSHVMTPFGKSLEMSSVIGPSLQTLQHQRKSFAGGPNTSTLSANPFPASATWSLRPCLSAKALT